MAFFRSRTFAPCGKRLLVTTTEISSKLPLKRIGVLGDIHCEDVRLAAALDFFQTQSLDMVCSVGDIVDGPGDPNRTIELLKQFEVVTVRGNHERWLVRSEMRGLPEAQTRFDFDALAWVFLNRLPIELEFETVAGRMLLTHGLRGDDMGGVWPFDNELTLHSNYPLWMMVASKKFAFVVNGHTHRRLIRTFGEMTIINGGTLYRRDDPCFCIADFEQLVVNYFNVDAEGRIESAERFPLPSKSNL